MCWLSLYLLCCWRITFLDIGEARKQLEDVLETTVRVAYFNYLAEWFRFQPGISKDVFDEKIRGLFRNKEQLIHHNNFLLALWNKAYSNYRAKPLRQVSNKGQFETADYAGDATKCINLQLDLIPEL